MVNFKKHADGGYVSIGGRAWMIGGAWKEVDHNHPNYGLFCCRIYSKGGWFKTVTATSLKELEIEALRYLELCSMNITADSTIDGVPFALYLKNLEQQKNNMNDIALSGLDEAKKENEQDRLKEKWGLALIALRAGIYDGETLKEIRDSLTLYDEFCELVGIEIE